MSRVNKMSLKEILEEVQLILRENDIAIFCDNYDVIREFIENFTKGPNKKENINKFLIDNEEHIDKEKLILLTVLNYRENLKLIDEKKNELLKNPEANFPQIANLHIEKEEQIRNLERAIKIGKGMETFLSFYYYDEKEKRYKIDIIDSREYIDKKNVSNTKNLKRFNEIDLNLKNGNQKESLGMEYIIQSILLTDLYQICATEQIGNDIRTMILENEVIKKGLKTKEELQALKTIENCNDYTNLVDNIKFQDMLPDIKDTLKEYVKYIDIDKLLLISAYRFNEGLENGYIHPELVVSVKEILRGILLHIKNQNMQISCELQTKKDNTYEEIDVEYSVKDIKKCIGKFTSNTYLTDNQIEEYKNKIQNKELNILEIEPEQLAIIYNKEELEKVAILSDINLKAVIAILKWDNEKIISAIKEKGKCETDLLIELVNSEEISFDDIVSLYLNSNISLEQIKKLKEDVDLSEKITSSELIQYYKNSIKKDSTEEERKKFNNYSELYKEVLIKDVEAEKLEDNYNNLVNSLMDNYKGEEYINVVKDFYQKGLVTLEVLVEWNEEKIIDRFYKDKIVSLTDIENLVKSNKLSFEYLSNIYKELANKEDINYEERLEYIKTGYILEKEIFIMYEKGLIFEKDLRDLANSGIVRLKETEKLINNRTKEDLEKNSSIKLVGLNELTKINNDIYADAGNDHGGRTPATEEDKAPKLIIDPNKREEYINLFNAYRVETDLEEDSPFYNYEFYVIPDESGDIGLNSVVIAERYYDNKDTEEKFALNNATYFFKYKDLMVLSNLKKSEMTKERENVVYTAKHILADKNKNGYWGAGVLYGIVKTMLSDDLKGYTKEQQRRIVLNKLNEIYSNEEILKILDMASEIDRGEHTYEIVNPVDTILRKTITKKKEGKIVDDTIR